MDQNFLDLLARTQSLHKRLGFLLHLTGVLAMVNALLVLLWLQRLGQC